MFEFGIIGLNYESEKSIIKEVLESRAIARKYTDTEDILIQRIHDALVFGVDLSILKYKISKNLEIMYTLTDEA